MPRLISEKKLRQLVQTKADDNLKKNNETNLTITKQVVCENLRSGNSRHTSHSARPKRQCTFQLDEQRMLIFNFPDSRSAHLT